MQYHISVFLLCLSMVQNNRCGNGVSSTKEKKERGKGQMVSMPQTKREVGERKEKVRCGGIDLLHNILSLWSC